MLRVTDVTQVSDWHGPLCAVCVIDMFTRRTVGWRVGRSICTDFMRSALEQALCDRRPERGGACVPLRAPFAIQMQ
ncbi:DDE-type integrase/transposase/recombinase [Verminephrobacter eiseniae]|uniref:DDE-type integrase/transposase/recombinase n=1 Tax=Verminephrobacter eiseniae TaxID=364317 RepID=UPI002237F10E|nr:DDE-type integrase/transposase/recombinase [Verminephrobacter eiseniae]MCW5232225.1 hypothetical protein [Verminephrobacter eiseniae]MCW5263036.1 hypothetical protein [Verminephrobacter eiseniae]MCW5296212.1 hypothetical protein [Verminephrobacter eiseniae]MCW8187670.1 hypothetical protein [Verminephrobacter eiseniae]MCW8225979.1 hypothetical protein [Verminephrobacter eiseniae]